MLPGRYRIYYDHGEGHGEGLAYQQDVFRDDNHSIIAVSSRYTHYSDPIATGKRTEHWQTTDYEILHLPDQDDKTLDELFTMADDVEQRVEALITPPK